MRTKRFAILAALCMAAIIGGANTAAANDAARMKTTVIGLGGAAEQFCDVITVTVFPWHQAGIYDDSCDGIDAIGSGMEGKVTGVSPKNLSIGESYFGDPSSTYLLNIQYPLVTGGGWSIFKSADGANYTPLSSGTYTIINPEAAHAQRVGRPAHASLR